MTRLRRNTVACACDAFLSCGGLLACAGFLACGGSGPPQTILPAPVIEATAAPHASATAPVPRVPAVDPNAVTILRGPPSDAQSSTPPMSDLTDPPLKAKWSTRIGKTTFRTTMAFVDGSIIVGTHGDTLDRQNEATDAVYVIDGKSGSIRRKIASPGKGDRDVSGVAVSAGYVYFGTDNGYVVKAKIADGSIAWSTQVKSKSPRIRPAPALARLDGSALSVVVGDEEGVLHIYAASDGKEIRSHATGENDYGGKGFVAAAAIADVDGDGRDDIIAGARDGNLVAYRGTDGTKLWSHEGGSGIHASPSVVDIDGDGKPEVLAAWSYSTIELLDLKSGSLRYHHALGLDQGGMEGLFGSPMVMPESPTIALKGRIIQGTSWWGGKRGNTAKARGLVDGIVVAAQTQRAFRSDEGRVTATAVVMDLGDDGRFEAIIGTEAGALLALDDRGGRRLLATLAGGIEASALIADVDGDGVQDILVASNNGMLTCFATDSRTPALVSRFRGNSLENRGDLSPTPLAWEVDTSAEVVDDEEPEPQRPSRSPRQRKNH